VAIVASDLLLPVSCICPASRSVCVLGGYYENAEQGSGVMSEREVKGEAVNVRRL
jgi:hypothetical protein